MSETMLEKAARALYEFGMMADCPKWDQLEQRYRQDFYDMARAVLMAVRDLTPEIVDTATDAAEEASETHADQIWPSMVSAGYTAAIDAILAQEPGS